MGLRISKPKVKEVIVEKVVTSVDTVYVPQTRTVSLTKIVPKLIYQDPDTVTKLVVLGKKNFMDTVAIDSTMKIMYSIGVWGELDSLSLGYIDTRPNTVITKTVTNFVSPKGVYIGGSVGINNVSVGAMYLKDKNTYGVSYNALYPKGVSLSYFRRIY